METSDCIKSKYQILLFFITTILFTWLLWLPAMLIQNYGVNLPLSYDIFITIGTFVPSVVGIVFTYLFGGKKEIYLLFKSLMNVRIKAKWILFIFLVLPGVSGVSCLIFSLLGTALPQMQFAPWVIPVAFVYILIFMGPLGEELGWRGFALKQMLRSISPIRATALIGIIWSVWHLPLFFISGTTQNALTVFGIFPALFGYFLYTVMISVLITLFFIKSNCSIFGSILLHTVGNLSIGFVPLIFIKKGAVILLLVLCVVTITILYTHRKSMFRKV